MDDQAELIEHYLPLIDAELRRIGFTDDDFRYLGFGGALTRERMDAHLAELRQIPTRIGAIAYYARYGVDFAALKREVEEREAEWGTG
jgi:hypothetical protein